MWVTLSRSAMRMSACRPSVQLYRSISVLGLLGLPAESDLSTGKTGSSLSWYTCRAHMSGVQADKSRVKDYIHRLDNFDGPAVGEIAVGYEMFDEAFEIYKKFGLKTQAIKVLLDNHEDLERALEYATKVMTSIHSFIVYHLFTHLSRTCLNPNTCACLSHVSMKNIGLPPLCLACRECLKTPAMPLLYPLVQRMLLSVNQAFALCGVVSSPACSYHRNLSCELSGAVAGG